ncbi:MAG: glutamate--cysteine ligase [Myxococcota bacterium]|jgi:glutamate--cysteine ligase
MSSHEGSGDTTPIASVEQLASYHAGGERPRAAWKVGTEYEKFAVALPDYTPLKYLPEGKLPGIKTLLNAMESCCGWKPLVDNGELIALSSDSGSISLEPGGQVELSGDAFATIHETADELRQHCRQLELLSAELSVRWIWIGAQPVHGLDDIGWMPKRRYAVMRDYLPTKGSMARHMMQSTCTVQANLDYASEADMARKMRMAFGVSSIVTAMFANSPLEGGKASKYKSRRSRIWLDTDNERSGLLRFALDGDGASYESYAEWALDVPLFFIMREGELINCAGLPFREFWKSGFEGHEATVEDWETHLSTMFPDVRIKTYMETRTADVVPPDLIPALPALWKGLCYDDTALDAAWDLVRKWSWSERLQHRNDVVRDALAARVPAGYETAELARELLQISRYGLQRQAAANGHEDESVFLNPLSKLTDQGKCPADVLLEWCAKDQPSPKQILEYLSR